MQALNFLGPYTAGSMYMYVFMIIVGYVEGFCQALKMRIHSGHSEMTPEQVLQSIASVQTKKCGPNTRTCNAQAGCRR